jgi:uncharacterized protein with GYD domain
MPFYLYELAYTPEAIKGLLANPTDREDAARAMIESLGGTLHHLFFAFGDYDVVCLIEAEDDTMMAAGAMVVASTGTVARGRTTKLMTAGDAMEAMKRSGAALAAYRPPMT